MRNPETNGYIPRQSSQVLPVLAYLPQAPFAIVRPRWDAVAVIARIYNNPKSHEKLSEQLYLCDIKGEHLHAVPEARGRLIDVRWIDNNRLAWLVDIQEGKLTECQLDLKTRRLTKSKKGSIDPIYWAEGSGRFKMNTEAAESVDEAHPGSFGANAPQPEWIYKSGAIEKIIKPEQGSPHGIVFDPKSNDLWFCNWDHNSTDGTWTAVYQFDWTSKTSKKLFDGASEFDFRPGRDAYAAVATRGLAKYGGSKNVWVARAWAGNLRTGKSWDIIGGLAYATSIALRP